MLHRVANFFRRVWAGLVGTKNAVVRAAVEPTVTDYPATGQRFEVRRQVGDRSWALPFTSGAEAAREFLRVKHARADGRCEFWHDAGAGWVRRDVYERADA